MSAETLAELFPEAPEEGVGEGESSEGIDEGEGEHSEGEGESDPE